MKTITSLSTSALLLTCTNLSAQVTESNILNYNQENKSFNQQVLEWSELRGELNFTRWCADKKDFFKSHVDTNGDNVVNKRDVSFFDENKLKSEAIAFIEAAFSYWTPDYISHLEKIKRLEEDYTYEKNIETIDFSNQNLHTIFKLLSLESLKEYPIYIKSTAQSDKIIIRDESFIEQGNKKIELEVPFQLTTHYGANSNSQDRILSVTMIKKQMNHNKDKEYGIISIKLNK